MTLRQFYRLAVGAFLTTVAVLVVLNVAVAIVGREPFRGFAISHPSSIGVAWAFGAVGIITVWFGMMWNCTVTHRNGCHDERGLR
jgi:hypothetical protein